MDNNSLPNGFISVGDAVALIEGNTYDNPVVDIKYLASHTDWLEVAHNFAIPKVRLITKDEYMDLMKRFPGRRPSELVKLGYANITLRSLYEVELVKKTIFENYAKLSGHKYVPKNTKGTTTVKDQASNDSVSPRRSKKTVAKEGDVIGSGTTSSTNSADGAGV